MKADAVQIRECGITHLSVLLYVSLQTTGVSPEGCILLSICSVKIPKYKLRAILAEMTWADLMFEHGFGHNTSCFEIWVRYAPLLYRVNRHSYTYSYQDSQYERGVSPEQAFTGLEEP